ncbi:MAG: HD domain-containing protein [Acidobacteria bacterium]|nr:HD domain-containing protein [Acidobacteriota bacterium]
MASRQQPPRLIIRTLAFTFATVAALLIATFVMLTYDLHTRVRRSAGEKLQTAQRVVETIERYRQQELAAWLGSFAQSPALRSAFGAYQQTASNGDGHHDQSALQREVERLALQMEADIVAVTDSRNVTIASAGKMLRAWPVSLQVKLESDSKGMTDGVINLPGGFGGLVRVTAVPLSLGSHPGKLYLGSKIDTTYAVEMASYAQTQTAIAFDGRVLVSTIAREHWDDVAPVFVDGHDTGKVSIGNDDHAYRKLLQMGRASFYAFESIDLAARAQMPDAYQALAYIGLGAMVLAAIASFWLARTLTRPIDDLSRAMALMGTTHEQPKKLTPTGSSLELDSLIGTFNELIESVTHAEDETRAAYLGAIRALAMALDARDPYTAGHSERVSALSVSLGRHMKLAPEALEVLRLGALLHDIGKIGISDAVLRKAGPLTSEEFEIIKLHPTLGARILKSVRFLQPHLPIVELHHERPDGRGYPHGLRGEEVPLAARIVHVADAYDAITSARAYRPGRQSSDAMAEIWRNRGTEFDSEVAEALVAVLPNVKLDEITREPITIPGHPKPSVVVSFSRGEERPRRSAHVAGRGA